MDERRDKFLVEMYGQMFNDINRHIMVVWQSVGVVISAFAVFALVEKEIIPLDFATCIIIILCGWLYAHLIDSGYWYNRNLAIIANIERQFLNKEDLMAIHYYFGQHRPGNKMLTHLSIQKFLGFGIGLLVLAVHFLTRVYDEFTWNYIEVNPTIVLPYIFVLATVIYGYKLRKKRNADYDEFIRNSPGINVDTAGIAYGSGHGFDKSNRSDQI